MTEHDLFAAIGQAEDAYLPVLEPVPTRRYPRHFGLIAAMLALILTACAAPAVIRSFDKLQSGQIVTSEHDKIREYWTECNGDGEILKQETKTIYVSGDFEIQVDAEADAPATIETHLLPLRMLELYDAVEYRDEDDLFLIQFHGKAPGGRSLIDIEYRQYALPEDGRVAVEDFFSYGPMEEKTRSYGDITVLEYSGYGASVDQSYFSVIESWDRTYYSVNTRYLFWSEGMYLYCLKLPRVYPLVNESDFEAVIASLAAVEDISEYLPAQE